MILGKARGSSRRATIRTEHLPQQPPVSPPAVDQGPEFLDVVYSLSMLLSTMLLSTEERVEPMNDLDNPLQDQDGRFGFERTFFHVTYSILILDRLRYSPLSDADIDATFNSMFTNSAWVDPSPDANIDPTGTG
jgi:hypothetical protein